MFELKEVTKRFEAGWNLGPLNLSFQAGRSTVLMGPSGCGKSTLLRLLMGLLSPDSGSVFFQGRPLKTEDLRLFRQRLGYVLQGGGLFPHLTAEDNVLLMGRYLKWDETRRSRRLAELAELTRFPLEALKRYPSQLSGGQRQRVSLMRALLLDPEVLCLDEPLGALDPMIRHELQVDLKTIFTQLKKTVLLVTHDLWEAAYLADHLVLLRAGQVVQSGTFAQLEKSPADPFVSRFIQAQQLPDALGGEKP